jgi:putative phosphonate metabolism protein
MRYALYFSPPQDACLVQAANSWLGRDAFSGAALPPPTEHGLPEDTWRDLTADPARYGFHATLKAPFSLAAGRSEADLLAAFDAICLQTPAASIERLALAGLGPFFALVPDGRAPTVDQLCARIVEAFEPFRAPLAPDDVARRKPERLTENQRAHLELWGYPYVFDEFRFHMTLTGPVSADEQPQVRAILEQRFAPFLGQPLEIGHLALFVEQQRGASFTIARHRPLTGKTSDNEAAT